jgi:glutathione S-transferase
MRFRCARGELEAAKLFYFYFSPQLILHHYDGSPYAEKIRCLLRLKGLDWRSLEVPPIDRGRITSDLAGGYRRIPVLQIGADMFCDTAEITRELEDRFPTPSRLADADGLGLATISWSDTSIFNNLVAQMDIAALGEDFVKDRLSLIGRKSFGPPELREAASQQMLPQLRTHCQILETQLKATGAYVMGPKVTVVDAAVWGHIWFLEVLSKQPNRPLLKELLGEMPAVKAWASRMSALMNDAKSKGLESSITAAEALQIATDALPHTAPPTVSDLDVKNGLCAGETVVVKVR